MAGGGTPTVGIGKVYLQVAPSLRGFFTTLDSQMSGNSMNNSGQRAGRSLGGGITDGVRGAMRKVGGIAKLVGGVGAALGGLATGFVTGATLKGGFERAIGIENAKSKLAGLGYEMKAVDGITEDTLKAVRGTAYSLDQVLGVAATGLASGIKEGEGLTNYLKLIADTATISGASIDEIGYTFNKVQAQGKASGISLMQIAQRGIPIYQWLSKEIGVSQDELMTLVRKGEVSSEDFRKAIEKNIGGAALESGNTFQGSLANMRAAFSRLGAILTGPSLPMFQQMFKNISKVVDEVAEKITPMVGKWWEAFGPKAQGYVDSFLQTLLSLVDGTYKVPKALQPIISFVEGLGKVWLNLQQIFQGGLLIVIGQVAGAFGAMQFNSINLPLLLSQIAQIVNNLSVVFGQLIVTLLPLLPTFVNFANTLITALLPVLVSISEIIRNFGPEIVAWGLTFLGAKLAITGVIFAISGFNSIVGVARGGLLALAGAQRTVTIWRRALNVSLLATAPILTRNVGAILASTLAWTRNTAVLIGARIAGLATASWLGIVTAAQWLWNTALTANPIGIIVVAIAALIAGIIYLATQTQFFQTIWAGIVTGVKASITWLTGAFTNLAKFFIGVFKAIGEGWANMWKGIGNFFIGIINAVINGINSLIKLINNISIPIPEWAQEFFGSKRLGFNIGTIGKIPALAKGGNVHGPTLALLGEGGRSETVTDLGGTNAMIANTNALLSRVQAGEVGVSDGEKENVIVNVYPSEGMNEDELAEKVIRKMRKQARR